MAEVDPLELAGCVGKSSYPTQPEADRVARRLRARKGGQCEAYRCQFCRNWHIGRSMDKRGRR